MRNGSRVLVVLAAALAASACSAAGGSARPSSSPSAAAAACSGQDHSLSDQLGWAFCYPQTWRFLEKAQPSDRPKGVDVTLDINDASGQASQNGQNGFVIIGTYDRGSAATLRDWMNANGLQSAALDPIAWGDAVEAGQIRGSDQRLALTPHSVVELDVRTGASQVGQEFTSRLSTWRFSY